jgi:hypothetical protein
MRPTDAGHRRSDPNDDRDDYRHDRDHYRHDRDDYRHDRDDYRNDRDDYRDDDDTAEQFENGNGYDERADDTPPFGVRPTTDAKPNGGSAPAMAAAPPSTPFEIRDRLIELDDLRRRGILSEEEFATKKSELLNRI